MLASTPVKSIFIFSGLLPFPDVESRNAAISNCYPVWLKGFESEAQDCGTKQESPQTSASLSFNVKQFNIGIDSQHNMSNKAPNNNSSLSWESLRPGGLSRCAHPQQENAKAKKQVEGHFPVRLYNMLEYATDNRHSWAFSWTDDGRSFTSHQEDWFVEHIIPMFFRQTKLRSFVSPSISFYYRTCLFGSWLERYLTQI